MINQKITVFRKKRELGPIVSDTFTFLRRNTKPMFSILVRTCSIPFIILIIANGFYAKISVGLSFSNITNLGDRIIHIIIAGLGLSVAGVLFSSMLFGSASEYIKAYISAGDRPDTKNVLAEIKKKTGSFIGLGFSNVLVIFIVLIIPITLGIFLISSGSEPIGFLILVMSIFPIIYLSVRFSIIYPVFSNENTSIIESFKQSSRLIKNEWWMTFFTILIMSILISIIGAVFQIPGAIYTVVKAIISAQSGSFSNPAEIFDGVYLTLQLIASAISNILYIILAISINFIYFNLNERKNQSGTLDQIDQIGSHNV